MGGKYTRINPGMTQEIDGSWAELQVFVPVDRYCKTEEEEPSPAPTRDHIYLILKVTEASPALHAQEGSLEGKGGVMSTY